MYIYTYIYMVFPTGGSGESPPPVRNLLIPQRFSSYNPIKAASLGVVNAPAPFLF